MPCSSVLSTAVAAKLNARIKELLNDGLSDSEIVRAIRREANTTRAWPEMTFSRIKQFINKAMEESEEASVASETSESEAPSFDSDEEDEEYVPPAEESDSEDEDFLVPEDESEDESEESESESSDETETDAEDTEECRVARFFFDQKDGTLDRLSITTNSDGTFAAEMAYDISSSYAYPKRANFFEADKDAMDLYVADILRMIAVDDLPFQSVEVALPFFPNITLTPKKLQKKSVRRLVRSALLQFLEHFEYA